MALVMGATGVTEFLAEVFPQTKGEFIIEELTPESIRVRMPVADRHLRPGGTVSGPSMFALADVSVYMMILGRIGKQALTVTTNCSIDFMRKPASGVDLIAEGRLLKMGRVLAVGDVHMRLDGTEGLVARATVTYSIPPAR